MVKENPKKNQSLRIKKFRFSATNQPSSEAKSRGWIKFRKKKAIRETFFEFADMTIDDLHGIERDMKENPAKWTVIQMKTVEYLLDKSLKVDFMNRGLEYVKSTQENLNVNINSDIKLTDEEKQDITDAFRKQGSKKVSS